MYLRFVKLAFVILFLRYTFSYSAFALEAAATPSAACSLKNLKSSIIVDGYLFASYRNDDDGACLRVISNHRVIFQRTLDNPVGYEIGQRADPQFNIPAIEDGTDVTGRGNPDLIVSYSTGGAHCCGFHYVFELEPRFHLLAMLSDRDDDIAHFEKTGADNRYCYVTADWTFAYWWVSFAGSPNHEVILRWQNDATGRGFHLAMDRMYRPAPSDKEWNDALNKTRDDLKLEEKNMVNFLPDDLWQEVLDLLYSGHSDLAWKFLAEVGPKAQENHYPDLADFCSHLKTSPYWPDLEPTLADIPKACAAAKRE